MSVGQRSHRIDLIRGVSILLVLFHHFNIAYRLDETLLARAFGWDAVRAVARNGNYGVTMFFVVSGFLITSNAQRRWAGLSNIEPRAFYGLRVARIIPCLLLLLATVNVFALAGVAIFQNHPQGGGQLSFWLVNFAALTFWTNVLIAHMGWANYPLGVLWSLSVEEVFYLSFPVLCLALRNDKRLIAFWAAVIVIGPVYRLFHQGDEAGFLFAYFASFDGIAIGCCTALLAHRLSLQGCRSAWKIDPSAGVIGVQKWLIRNLGAACGSYGCAGTHSMNRSEFMLSRVQAPSAPRACRPRRRSGAAHP